MPVELINLQTRLCAKYGIALRISKYYREAKLINTTCLGYYKGYKSHCFTAVTDIIISLVFI
jgi:hypothetical protein